MFIWRHITTRPVDSLHRRIWNLHDRKENLSGHCGTDRERQFIIRNLVRALWGTEREAIHNQESCPGTVGQRERGSSQSGVLSGHCGTDRERQFTIRSLVRALWDRQRCNTQSGILSEYDKSGGLCPVAESVVQTTDTDSVTDLGPGSRLVTQITVLLHARAKSRKRFSNCCPVHDIYKLP